MGRRRVGALVVGVALALAGLAFLVLDGGDRSDAPPAEPLRELVRGLDIEEEACCPALVGNAAGDAALVWSDPGEEGSSRGSGLHVAFLRGREWSAGTRIPGSPYPPRRAVQGMLADGSVVVVWEPTPDPGGVATVKAAIVGRAGAVKSRTLFARPAARDGSGPFPAQGVRVDELTAVAVSGDRALVAWGWRDRSGGHLGVAVWRGGRWTTGEAPADDRSLPWRASVAIDRRGDVLAIWWQDEYAPRMVRTPVRGSYRPEGEAWSAPQTVARVAPGRIDVLARPTATFLREGRPAVQWAARWRGGRVAVQVRARVHGAWQAVPARGIGALGSEVPIRVAGNEVAPPTRVGVAVGGGGARPEIARVPVGADFAVRGRHAAFVWLDLPDHPGYLISQYQAPIRYSILEPAGFSGPYTIPDAEAKVEAAALLLPEGTLVVAYVSDARVEAEDGLYAVVLDPADGWREPVLVAD